MRSSPIWKRLVTDAKARCCFHEGNKDKTLDQVITNNLIEHGNLSKRMAEMSLVKEAGSISSSSSKAPS